MNAMSDSGDDANRIRPAGPDSPRWRGRIFADRLTTSAVAARHAAAAIRQCADLRGEVRLVLATAASQIDFLRALAAAPDINWRVVELFQLDEYLDLPPDHPAAFRQLLRTHFLERAEVGTCHFIERTADPEDTCAALGRLLAGRPLDLACVGIGENAHVAFNDPPADFATASAYVVVQLDEACRRQQVGEGWFEALTDVPSRAITMSIPEILRAREIVAVVPDKRKAAAVKAAIDGEVDPDVPASILRTHANATLYLDEAAASALRPKTRAALLDPQR
jgi:glucosamine-6-phosphate deaminase